MKSRHFEATLKQRKNMLYTYIAFLMLLAFSFIIMPFGNMNPEAVSPVLYISGVAFWIGIAGTIIMAIRITVLRKNSSKFNEKYSDLKKIGLIHFFQNKSAKIIDILMFLFLAGFVVTQFFSSALIASFVCLGLFVFSFGMHCMLNGTNYTYINFKHRGDGKS